MSERANVSAAHLHRRACVDVHQSTTAQVERKPRVDRTRRYTMNESAKVSAAHLHRRARVYVRQSTDAQVERNHESIERGGTR